MFGRNGKISKRQIRRILILEQAAKIGLLLPLPAQIREGGFSIWSWILTAALTFLYLKIMLDFSKKLPEYPATDRKKGMENRAAENRKDGTGQAEITILTVVYGIYGLADVFFLLCLFAEVAQCRHDLQKCPILLKQGNALHIIFVAVIHRLKHLFHLSSVVSLDDIIIKCI